jgi:hypothetical protein
VPDLKVMDADINMTAGEVNASTLLDFFNQLSSKSSSSLESLPIKEEPLSEEDLRALQKDRQKKDNHNMSKSFVLSLKSFSILTALYPGMLLQEVNTHETNYRNSIRIHELSILVIYLLQNIQNIYIINIIKKLIF